MEAGRLEVLTSFGMLYTHASFLSRPSLSGSWTAPLQCSYYHMPLSVQVSHPPKVSKRWPCLLSLRAHPRVLDRGSHSSPRGSVICTAGPKGSRIKTCIRSPMLKGTLLPLSNLSLSPLFALHGVYIQLKCWAPSISALMGDRLSSAWLVRLWRGLSCFSYTHE